MLKRFAKLSYEPLFDNSHYLRFIIVDFNWSMWCSCGVEIRSDCSLILHASHRHTSSLCCNFFDLFHYLNTLDESVHSCASYFGLLEVGIHLFEMFLNELVDNLSWQVNPNIENTIFFFVMSERVL